MGVNVDQFVTNLVALPLGKLTMAAVIFTRVTVWFGNKSP